MRRAVLVVVIAMLCGSATAMSRSVRPVNIWQIWFQNIRPVVLAPGEKYPFSLGTWFSWFQFVPATAVEVAWTVEPPFGHATISADGTLSVDTSAESLTTYMVYANLNHGTRIISTPVYVYRTGTNPFYDAGWLQTASIPCDGSADVPTAEPIEEFGFSVDGRYSVTWRPFEIYKDYWGPYTFDLDRHRITFGVSGGNYIPDDMHGDGTFQIRKVGDPSTNPWGVTSQRWELRLIGIWLGTPYKKSATVPQPCGMVFDGFQTISYTPQP